MNRSDTEETLKCEAAVLRALHERSGFLLRRAHQIASALFMEETAELGVTSTQFGMLTVLDACQPIDQINAARLLRLDRSTTGLVVRNLEERGLIARVLDPDDRRRRLLRITDEGREMLRALQQLGTISQRRALSVLGDEEAQTFLALLSKFVEGHER
jgi:DNA-binding MarR family transcriptional regulator